MAKLTRHEWAFEFTPWSIARLLDDLPLSVNYGVMKELESAWDDSEPFEVEVEIPLREHPHVHILTIAVDPTTQQFTIERRLP